MSSADRCPKYVRFDGTPMHCVEPKNHEGWHVANILDPTGRQHEIVWREPTNTVWRKP